MADEADLVQLVHDLEDEHVGGVWVDRSSAALVVLALPSLTEESRQRLRAAVAPRISCRFEVADLPWSTLKVWARRLSESLILRWPSSGLRSDLDQLGLEVLGVNPSVRLNRVLVSLSDRPLDYRQLDGMWNRAVAAGEAPPRSYAVFGVGSPIGPAFRHWIAPPSTHLEARL